MPIKGSDNPKPWKKGQSGNPAGRPKKIENVLRDYFLAEHNLKLSKNQMSDIIQVMLSKTKTELVELAKNDEMPFWISLIAKKAQRDYEKGSIHILDVLFDRVYGRPKEEVENTVTTEFRILNIDPLDDSSDDKPA
jgi:hypothetical protein